MNPQPITDHVRAGILKLVPPFWGKPRIAAGLQAVLIEVQALEDAIWGVVNGRLLPNATGWALAMLGKIVGQDNLGYDTETFRTLIGGRILANRSNGRRGDLLAVLRVIFGAGPAIWIQDGGGATYRAFVFGETLARRAVRVLLSITRAAGVGLELWTGTDDGTGLIGYSVTDLPEIGPLGWGTVTDGLIGGLAYHIARI
jgi:hypothetical protein